MTKKWIPLWVIPILIILSVGTVWLRLSIVRTTYAIHQVDLDLAQVRHEKERVQLKVTALRSPRRLEELARTQFKLVQPRVDQIVYLKKTEGKGNEL